MAGTDTLVSTAVDGFNWEASEFASEQGPYGSITYRSTVDTTAPVFGSEATSEQDFLINCTDTVVAAWQTPDYLAARPHRPLGISISQKSYAWSESYAEDFILFDMVIKNLGWQYLEDVYVGLYVDCDVAFGAEDWQGTQYDDITGFLRTFPSSRGCGFIDTLNLAWIADNDGDPLNGAWVNSWAGKSCVAVTGVHFLRPPGEQQSFSYNWWISNSSDPIYDWGPRAKPTADKPLRDFRTGGSGTPRGDANKYYQMSNGEFDYDQAYTSRINGLDPQWLTPPINRSADYADGFDTRYLLSYGPFNIPPGATLPFAFTYVAGDNFHTDPGNGAWLTAGDPDRFYEGVNFKDLAENSRWAEWVYDNPGVDTDSDGYFGEYHVCVLDSQLIDGHWVPSAADTSWVKGDGVPDWRAVQPPPAPHFWLEPGLNSLRIRFNGQASETTKDIFSGIIDFEGYRVYIGRDERESSLSVLASYDRDNYDKWVYSSEVAGSGDWSVQEIPFTVEQLRCRYGQGTSPCQDSTFDPLAYTLSNPYRVADSAFFFVPHEYNGSLSASAIHKVYPTARKPGPTDTVTAEDLTPEGHLKYYEYEYVISNLLPTVAYFVNVTAFDFGSPEVDLPALETSKMLGIKHAYPLADASQLAGQQPVYIYPNPYRIDGSYHTKGYEDRYQTGANPDRNRLIHFVNVPASCIIRIYTLDGDLVRAIKHEYAPSDPNSSHETWDMINRNIQAVVSGLYYWTVEDSQGQVQMGKLVVIK